MKIGILTNTYPPNLNGVSIAVSNLEESLKSKGIEVFIATPCVKNVEYADNVLPIDAIPTKVKVSPDLYIPQKYIDDVVEFFREKQVDLIHTHDIFMGGAEGIVIAAKLGIPCIHTFHTFVESYPYLQVPARKKIIRAHIRLVCNNYNHITAPSMKVYKYLAQIGFETPVTQILNVPSESYLQIKPKNKELAAKYGIQENDFVFATFCRVAKEKSIDIGLIAIHKLLKKYSNIKYLICGQGPEIANLQLLANHLDISDKVIFTGKYQPAELSDLGSISDVFLFTSHTENLPTNLFEAMRLGLPVLSVDDESVDYLLQHGFNGYKGTVDELSSYAEALYTDKHLLNALSKNAYETGQNLLSKDIIQEYVDLYDRVIRHYHEEPVDIEEIGLLLQTQKLSKFIQKGIKKVIG